MKTDLEWLPILTFKEMGKALQKDKGNQRRSAVAVCSAKTEFLLLLYFAVLKQPCFIVD